MALFSLIVLMCR